MNSGNRDEPENLISGTLIAVCVSKLGDKGQGEGEIDSNYDGRL